MLSEFQIILNLSIEDTQKKLDKALKRNVKSQTKPETTETKEPSTTSKMQIDEDLGGDEDATDDE